MHPEEFIKKHITDSLVSEGFPPSVVRGGADAGLEHYRRCSQATRKGRIFDDCLFRARQWAIGQTTVAERKEGKKKAGREGKSPTGLF